MFAVMPRKRRSFVRKRSKSAPATLYRASPKRPKTRKGWPEESMTAALKAVEEGQSISQAARDHGIPINHYDRISGRVTPGTIDLDHNLT